MRSTMLLVGALVSALVATRTDAADLIGAGPIRENYREGFLMGFSVGAGGIAPDSCRDCGLGVGVELHIGAVASREVAVMLEGSFLGRSNTSHAFVAVAAQWWPDPAGRFWVKGGIGIGDHSTDEEVRVTPEGRFEIVGPEDRGGVFPSVFAAGGVEVVRAGRFTIDIQLRGAATKEPSFWGRGGGLSVGLNWY